MAKKVKLNLTYSADKLWWSTDGMNWAIVGPSSPVTILDKDADIQWLADGTIEIVDIIPQNTGVMDKPTGNVKDKIGKIKDKVKTGDRCKYDVVIKVAATGQEISFDPDIQVCSPEPPTGCPPLPPK